MTYRTYGWIQNPSSFKTLKKVVQIFDPNSSHYQDLTNRLIHTIYFEDIRNSLRSKLNYGVKEFTYQELVGTSKDKYKKPAKSRSEAVADALIQITISPQQSATTGKTWTDNWTSDGFLRWAVTLNFVSADRETDIFKITYLGSEFSRSEDDSVEEERILTDAILSYPPATHILTMLNEAKDYCSKFYLGSRLGFISEGGFTSYSETSMYEMLEAASKSERNRIKSNIEGTSDKYARMICKWLMKLGLVDQIKGMRTLNDGTIDGFPEYKITASGQNALTRINGGSKHQKITKFIMWEFLATKGNNRNYVRTRRAYIIKFLQETESLERLFSKLNNKGFKESPEIFLNDIEGLKNIGLRIEIADNKIILRDNICDFSIPDIQVTAEIIDEQLEKKKLYFLKHTQINRKYLVLLEYAYSKEHSRDFEIYTMELFREVYGIGSKILSGPKKPDGILYTTDFGVIVDTKAYSEGYGKSASQKRQMIDYIMDAEEKDSKRNSSEWWRFFPEQIRDIFFLWVSGKFVKNFKEQLEETHYVTKVNGGALNVYQLLLGAHCVLIGKLEPSDLPKYFNNDEIIFFDSDELH